MIQHSNTAIGKEELMAIQKVLDHGNLTAGRENNAFRQELRNYIGAEYVRLTSSGTMAFYLIMMALEIKPGDEVLMPDYICNELLGPVFAMGATPVVYDNRKDSWLSSEDEIISLLTHKTRLVLVNHTFGFVLRNLKSLRSLLPASIMIVEDCCHAIIGKSSQYWQFTNHHSICCFYSFNATKLLAAGEGGAISSNNESFIHKLEKTKIGDNLSDLNCSIARKQLKRFDYFLERRNEIAQIYLKSFSSLLAKDHYENAGLFFRFPLLVGENPLFWTNNKIAFRKGVDSLISEYLNAEPQPNAYRVLKATVSLPIYPALQDDQLNIVVKETKKILQL